MSNTSTGREIEGELIEIVTVYTPHEANTYLLDDYLKDPTKAKVLKRLKYQKSPVIRMNLKPNKDLKGEL